jgi:hypothetical protein
MAGNIHQIQNHLKLKVIGIPLKKLEYVLIGLLGPD